MGGPHPISGVGITLGPRSVAPAERAGTQGRIRGHISITLPSVERNLGTPRGKKGASAFARLSALQPLAGQPLAWGVSAYPRACYGII